MERKTVVYIAGKVTGLPDKGQAAFALMHASLNARGYIVINPTLLPDGMDSSKYLPICLALVNAADAVFMLDNWKDSKGAGIEYEFAKYQGKPVFTSIKELTECMPPVIQETANESRQ